MVLSVKSIKNVIKPNILYISYKTLLLSSISNKCWSEDEKIFKEEESIEILQIIGLINYKEYQKRHNYVSKKHIKNSYWKK